MASDESYDPVNSIKPWLVRNAVWVMLVAFLYYFVASLYYDDPRAMRFGEVAAGCIVLFFVVVSYLDFEVSRRLP